MISHGYCWPTVWDLLVSLFSLYMYTIAGHEPLILQVLIKTLFIYFKFCVKALLNRHAKYSTGVPLTVKDFQPNQLKSSI